MVEEVEGDELWKGVATQRGLRVAVGSAASASVVFAAAVAAAAAFVDAAVVPGVAAAVVAGYVGRARGPQHCRFGPHDWGGR